MNFLNMRDFKAIPAVHWGEANPYDRGPLICMSRSQPVNFNCIGNYGGQYTTYRSLAHAMREIPVEHIPDFENFVSHIRRPQNPSWSGANAISTFDPFGHLVPEHFDDYIAAGFNIRPTISITPTTLIIPEIGEAMRKGLLKADGRVLTEEGRVNAVKIAIEPVWHLPSIARYLNVDEGNLREELYFGAGGGPQALLDPRYSVFLPPFGETTVYVMGDFNKIGQEGVVHSARTHDKCGSSDTHGATICSCRPALTWGYEQGVIEAQKGGVSLIVYTEAEGRGHGVVLKNGVYNARMVCDTPENYFTATERVTGVADMRRQDFAPDVYRWLGISKIDVWMSGSPDKTAAMQRAGIEIAGERPLPTDRLPPDVAVVEVEAKRRIGGYHYEPRSKIAAAGD